MGSGTVAEFSILSSLESIQSGPQCWEGETAWNSGAHWSDRPGLGRPEVRLGKRPLTALVVNLPLSYKATDPLSFTEELRAAPAEGEAVGFLPPPLAGSSWPPTPWKSQFLP